MNPTRIRLLVVDDHELIREGIKKIIRSARTLELVAEASNLDDAARLIASHRPDIVVLDISLPGRDGLDGLEEMRRLFPLIPFLVLSMHPEERYAIRALKAGAAGYITKSMAAEELIAAVHRIMESGTYISPKVGELLASSIRQPGSKPAHELLTARELDVVSLLASGKQPKQIAAELEISISSVNTYRNRIFRKTGLSTNAALIRYALEHGLTP